MINHGAEPPEPTKPVDITPTFHYADDKLAAIELAASTIQVQQAAHTMLDALLDQKNPDQTPDQYETIYRIWRRSLKATKRLAGALFIMYGETAARDIIQEARRRAGYDLVR